METLTPKQLADKITDFVNCYGRRSGEEFCEAMTYQHRTLQQSFTRLCLQWLEKVADDNYLTDGRNEASKQVAQNLLENSSQLYMDEPSKYLPVI